MKKLSSLFLKFCGMLSLFLSSTTLIMAETDDISPIMKFFQSGELYTTFTWVGAGVLVLTLASIIFMVARFKARRNPKWTLLLLVMFIIVGVLTVRFVLVVDEPPVAQDSSDISDVSPILKFFKLGESPYTTVDPANAISREVNHLYGIFTWLGVGIFALTLLSFIIMVVMFNEKRHPKPKDIHGNFFLEVLWTTLPIIVVILIGVPTIRLLFKIDEQPVAQNSGFVFAGDPSVQYPKILDVTVIGHQWWWEFEYTGWRVLDSDTGQVKTIPLSRVTANEAYFPVNTPINLTLVSEDVIHSLWVPRISGKRDVMPGRLNSMRWLFEESASYSGECGLYCGASHSLMRFHAHAVSPEDFDSWLDWGKGEVVVKTAAAKRGLEQMPSCLVCHTMGGVNTFVPRVEQLDQAVKHYNERNRVYEEDIAHWEKKMAGQKKWGRELREDPTRPKKPIVPKLYQGDLVTIAPDLTDLLYRPKIMAGIKPNTRENLLAWIKDPVSFKPEEPGTPTVRMPAYRHIYSDQTISDVIEFLLTVEYDQSEKLTFAPANYSDNPAWVKRQDAINAAVVAAYLEQGEVDDDGHTHSDDGHHH